MCLSSVQIAEVIWSLKYPVKTYKSDESCEGYKNTINILYYVFFLQLFFVS